MSHDRGCYKCGRDNSEYDDCQSFNCPKRVLNNLPTSNPLEKENNLIRKTAKWVTKSSKEISKAGGNPDTLLSMISDEVIVTLVRNNLYITYKKEGNGHD